MPRIKAGSVAEHRAAVMAQLLDGTERLLLSGPDATLTAAGIAAEAGIARNSIYRYVSSVDDLIEMVLERGFTDWSTAVTERVAEAPDPRTAILTYAEANLEFAADGRHAWRTAISRIHLSDNARSRVMALHEQITDTLHEAIAAEQAESEYVPTSATPEEWAKIVAGTSAGAHVTSVEVMGAQQ